MPTGYTSKLYDGEEQTFPEFAMECARAFGALVTLRDSPGAEIPDEFQPSDYHRRALDGARADLQFAESMTPDHAAEVARRKREEAIQRAKEERARCEARLDRYGSMLARVEAWQPPTPDHEELQSFMADQLRQSIKFDTGYTPPIPPEKSGEEYRRERIEQAKRDIAHHEKGYRIDVERARDRTEWVQQLRASLPPIHGEEPA